MRLIYSLPICRVQQPSSIICQGKDKKTVSTHEISPCLLPVQESILLNNRQMSKATIKNLSPHTQVYLVIDFIKNSLDVKDLQNKIQERIQSMEDPSNPYWQNQDEILGFMMDFLEWQKKNRKKEPVPQELVYYQNLVLGHLLMRVNEFQLYCRSSEERWYELLFYNQILPGSHPNCGEEMETMITTREFLAQCLVNDIIKLGESYGRLDLIEGKVPEELKPLARELLEAIEKNGTLSNRLSS